MATDIAKRLEETNAAIAAIKSLTGNVPEEALEIQEIMQRCIDAEAKIDELETQIAGLQERLTRFAIQNGHLLIKSHRIRSLCQSRNNPGVNVGAHELAGMVLKILEEG